jgi:tol-pal system protein YbgF
MMVKTVLDKKRLWGVWAILSCMALFSSCATNQKEILQLRSAIDNEAQLTRQRHAALVSQVDTLRTELQELSAQVEDTKEVVRHFVEKDTSESDRMKDSIAKLTARTEKLEDILVKSGERPDTSSADRTTYPEPSVGPLGTEEDISQPIPGEKIISNQEKAYESVLSTYKEGKYEEAIAGFEAFMSNYPNSVLADNAQFWIGESYASLKQYKQAILAYQRVITNYPEGDKAPNAMLRQAVAFSEIDDKISSKLLLEKIIKMYPDSDEAKIAKEKLKTFN